jgi:transcriptional regulator with XRE-family HTH domain
MDIISKIEKLRIERGWSEYELSQQSLITQSTLASYKQRNTPPKIETLQALCDAFGITLAQFFLEDEQVEIVSDTEKELLTIFRSLPDNKKQALINLIKK